MKACRSEATRAALSVETSVRPVLWRETEWPAIPFSLPLLYVPPYMQQIYVSPAETVLGLGR